MNKGSRLLVCLFMVHLALSGLAEAAEIKWDGGGDGSSFSDPANWDVDNVPTATDVAEIDSVNADVVISGAVTVDAIELLSEATLTINAGATLRLEGVVENADILELDDASSVLNYGTVIFDNPDMFICIDLEDESSFDNFGTIECIGQGSLFIGLQTDDENTTFRNHLGARIDISGTEFIAIQNDGPVINEGIINIEGFEFKAIQLDAYEAREPVIFQNYGVLNIVNDFEGAEYVDITSENAFLNTGVVNFQGADEVAAFEFADDYSVLQNEDCGIINLDGPLFFDVDDPDALLINDGVIASAFNGSHINEGTITNNGRIQTTTGVFSVLGAGTFDGAGVVESGGVPTAKPLSENCPIVTGKIPPPQPVATLPTFFLLGLTGLLALFGFYRVRALK